MAAARTGKCFGLSVMFSGVFCFLVRLLCFWPSFVFSLICYAFGRLLFFVGLMCFGRFLFLVGFDHFLCMFVR